MLAASSWAIRSKRGRLPADLVPSSVCQNRRNAAKRSNRYPLGPEGPMQPVREISAAHSQPAAHHQSLEFEARGCAGLRFPHAPTRIPLHRVGPTIPPRRSGLRTGACTTTRGSWRLFDPRPPRLRERLVVLAYPSLTGQIANRGRLVLTSTRHSPVQERV
eukprot:scaffold322048_cov28-Tisochrysis_lutea.AAC.1